MSTSNNFCRNYGNYATHVENSNNVNSPVINIQMVIISDGTKHSVSIDRLAEIIRSAGPDGLAKAFDALGLDSGRRQAAVEAVRYGDSNRAGQIVLDAGRQQMRESTKQLSRDAGGRKSVRSAHGNYISAAEDWRSKEVGLANGAKGNLENWHIEDWNAKVVLKARGGPNIPGRFLQAHPNGHVDLSYKHPKDCEDQMWRPFLNSDGSWSLLSVHGQWLSARQDGTLCTVNNCDGWERFRLERW